MENSISAMSPQEFETLVQKVIDNRMSVWLTQLFDALSGSEENDEHLKSEFINALERSIAQADAGQIKDLRSFRTQLTDE